MTMRVAVIGAGYFARFHHEAWQRLNGAELVAICDSDVEKAREAAALAGAPEAFADAALMLDAVSPELIDIATPPESHLELVTLAAEAGLPAICQKPLAPTLAEAREVTAVAEQNGTLLAVHENFRFQPWFRETRRLIDAGTLGELHSIAFRLRPGDGQGANAYLDRQPYFQTMERFLIHETAIHFVDVFRYLMGEAVAVTAQLRRINPVIAGEDAGYVIFEFEGGATGLFDGNRLNDHSADNTRRTMGEMWLEGKKGVLRLDGMGRLWRKPHGGPESEHAYDWQDRGFAGDCVYQLQAHVIDHFVNGAALANKAPDYLRNVEIEEAIYRAAESGRRLPIE
jgi:predicted dehydrogenase